MSRPLAIAVYGPEGSTTARMLSDAERGGRVARIAVNARGARAFVAAARRSNPDLVLIDPAVPRARTVLFLLNACGVRAVDASGFTTAEGHGRLVLNVGALAAASARPGAALRGGPDVSVVVTVLNEDEAIVNLVATLTAQMRSTDQLVLVDGGSTDATWSRLQRRQAEDARVLALSLPGCTISGGRNHGIRIARHDVIVCTDAGCAPQRGWLDALRSGFAETPPPALVAGVPRITARTALQRAQASACHPDPGDLRHPSLLVRLYAKLFGTGFDPSLPFARSLAFTRAAWQRAGGFPETLITTEDGVFGRAVSHHGTCLASLDAEVTWDQRPSLRETYRMYRRYGEGAAQSGDRTLRARDAVRALAYPTALLMLARAPRRAAPFLTGAAAMYLSLPLRRLSRRGSLMPAALLLPVAMVTKDVGKVHGAVRGTVAGLRHRRVQAHSRTRVLVVLPSLDTGGAERHALTMYPALDRTRFDVRLLCIKGRGALYEEAVATGLPVETLDTGESNVAILRTYRRLYAEMRAFRPDVVATSGFSADVVGRLAAAAARVPAVITWKHNCGHVGRYGIKERAVERVLGSLTTRYLAVATAQVDYLTGYLRLPAGRISVIHNSVRMPATVPDSGSLDRLRSSIGVDEGDVVIGVVAALRSWKGHATLLRAFQVILAQDSRARLLIVGDGEERDNLDGLSRSLRIQHRVHQLGDRRDVEALLGVIDVVVLPSHTIECFPFAVLEAMSHSRPTVATDIGGLPELIESGVTGLLVKAGDHHALAAALLTVMETPDRGASLGRAGCRRLVDLFPFEATVHRIEDEIEAAVAASAHGRRAPRRTS